MHNLGNVFNFEMTRTLKKKSFWIVSLLFPIMAGVIAGVIYFSNQATDSASKKSSQERFSLEVSDPSHLVNPLLLRSLGAKQATSKAAGINDVKTGKVDAYFYYPSNITTQKVEVYSKDVGLFDNSRYSSTATALLSESARQTVKPAVATILSGNVKTDMTTYKDGEVYNGLQQMIAPGVFLVIFYILIATFGNQMLSSTTEEKENRVIEMILTTIEARTLVVGKILSLVVLGLLQMIIILTPIAIGYLLLHDRLDLPTLDLAHLTFDWGRIAVSFAIFFVSYMLFTGLLVAIGSATPTAKEAGPFFGIVMMLIFGPLYAAPLFISSPHTGIVETLSLIPFTAPIPLLLRNAVGNLDAWEVALSLFILIVTTSIVVALGVRTFKYGALEYSRKLSIKEILTRKA